MKSWKIVFFALLILYIVLDLTLFLQVPFIWPDEAIYADIAYNFIHYQRFGTDLFGNMTPGISSCACWHPPLFFYIEIIWLKIVGISIFNQRILSLIAGSIFIVIFFKFIQEYLKSIYNSKNKNSIFVGYLVALLITGLLILDPLFQKAARISRPEIFFLVFGIFAVYLFIKKADSTKKKYLYIIFSGFFSSLAVLTHVVALVFPVSILLSILIVERWHIFKSKIVYLYLLFFLFPLIIWVISTIPNLDIVTKQFSLAFFNKSTTPFWILIVFAQESFFFKVLILFYIFLSWEFITFSFINKRTEYLTLSILIILMWVVGIFGRMEWYFVFPIPFVYLSLALLCFEKLNREPFVKRMYLRQYFSIPLLVSISFFILSSQIYINYLNQPIVNQEEYNLFIKKGKDIIPENKTVLLSSIPSAYYGFKQDRNSQLYQFPALKASKESIYEVFRNTDFIIFNGHFGEATFTNYLVDYLKKNTLNTFKIENSSIKANIIELKPRSERIE